ncbi:uncharacterized protein LOC130892726 isoform X1 [Diorhabda carinulata]|uniref:uncharacterized protein LOC130892726 isoform X1 n=1 Tax=Diorhabda carinulata TaxID=1163345 RepID=UPI0025A17933|nr:uncharacterized protein LOC130892726 isoform X1 [Diorhabda carinulata]
MEYTVDLDLEDLEARLYSQIYYSNNEIEEAETSVIPKNITVDDNVGKKYRYFDNPAKENYNILTVPQTFIPLTNPPNDNSVNTIQQPPLNLIPNCNVGSSSQDKEIIVNNLPKSAVSYSGSEREIIQNNITVNQYSFPVVINSTSKPWTPTSKVLERNKKNLERKKKARQRKRKNKNLTEVNQAISDPVIVCISDSDDCNVVEEDMNSNEKSKQINTKFPKKYNEAEGDKLPEVDDDVIFIPPPPVEVINVDSSEQDVEHTGTAVEEKNETNISESINPESNDFLETNIEPNNANFDFALHGSDFSTDPTEFRQPLKPVEYCETESSCSTNDQSRDFSNTVKTIVFAEVDFPKEDIFSEKNLESFSSFITPKRSSVKSKEVTNISEEPKDLSDNNDVSTDTSSSESDYETNYSEKTNSCLPNLSPMVPDIIQKEKKTVICEHDKSSTVKNKRKGLHKPIETIRKEGNGNLVDNTISKTPKSKRRKKKVEYSTPLSDKNTSEKYISTDTNKVDEVPLNCLENSKRKKKRRSTSNNSKENENMTNTDLVTPAELTEQQIDIVESTENDNQEKIKNKKKKKNLKDTEAPGSTTNRTPLSVELENLKKNVEITMELNQKLDSKSKKKKKSESSSTDVTENSELSNKKTVREITNEENMKIKRKQSEKDNTDKIIDKDTQIKDSEEPSTSKSDNPLDNSNNELIVIDDVSSTYISVSSDNTDTDFEIFDDISTNITLNCDTSILPPNDYERISKAARFHLDNYEKFDVSDIQSKQSDDPNKWLISYRDRATYLNNRGNIGPRCTRCRHFGHISIKCPEKPHPPPCILCGESNHQEPRCPFKMCTQCGQRGNYSTTYCHNCFKFRNCVCRLCKMVGHIEKNCPDLWRRYRSTTDKGPMVTSPELPKPRFQQWCSGCAKQGHLEHECNYFNRYYPPTTPFINNYEDNLQYNKQMELQQTSIASATVSTSETIQVSSLDSLVTTNKSVQIVNDVPSTSKNDSVNITYNIDVDDPWQIKKLFMTTSHFKVTQFIKDQMNDLQRNPMDPRILKRKIIRCEKLTDSRRDPPERILREKNHWYRLLNMLIFGTHKHNSGLWHINQLKKYISEAHHVRLDGDKRVSLFNSYSYIFGCDKHANFDYYKILRLLIRKYYSNNKNLL